MKLTAAIATFSLVFVSTLITSSYSPDVSAQGIQGVWRAPPGQINKPNPIPPGPHSKDQGQGIYAQECVQCHGRNGFGEGALAPTLNQTVTNLTQKSVWQQSDGAIFWKIRTGKQAILSYRHKLAREDVWHVINYTRGEFSR
jgi:cytochrome c553